MTAPSIITGVKPSSIHILGINAYERHNSYRESKTSAHFECVAYKRPTGRTHSSSFLALAGSLFAKISSKRIYRTILCASFIQLYDYFKFYIRSVSAHSLLADKYTLKKIFFFLPSINESLSVKGQGLYHAERGSSRVEHV